MWSMPNPWARLGGLMLDPLGERVARFFGSDLDHYRVAVPFRVFCTLRNAASGSNSQL